MPHYAKTTSTWFGERQKMFFSKTAGKIGADILICGYTQRPGQKAHGGKMRIRTVHVQHVIFAASLTCLMSPATILLWLSFKQTRRDNYEEQ